MTPTCHPDRAHVGNGLCQPCYDRAYREANSDRLQARQRAYYERNRERLIAVAARRNQENAEARRVYLRKLYAEDIEARRALSRTQSSKRRSSCKANTPHPATPEQRAALVAPGETCLYCDVAPAVHVDHFIPIARWNEVQLTAQQRADGPDHISNLVGACAACNLSKGARLPDVEWRGRGVEP